MAQAIDGQEVDFLSTGIACQINCVYNKTTQERVEHLLKNMPIDANFTHIHNQRKSLLVADMESTIIQEECLDELADFLNLRPKISDITERAMRGEIEFEAALSERVLLLKGLPVTKLQEVYDTKVNLMPGAQTLLSTMVKNNAICSLVSGGFSFFTERIAKRLGFTHWRSNRLNIIDGHLDGTIHTPILGRQDKARFLAQWQTEQNLTPKQTMTVGDGANDLDMLTQTNAGIAFHAKPAVAKAAPLTVNHSDLTALLYIQGYKKSEFIEAL